MYLIFSEFWRVGVECGGKRERLGYEGPGSTLGCDFFLIETLSITGQKFSKFLKDGSELLRKGQLRRRAQCYLDFSLSLFL